MTYWACVGQWAVPKIACTEHGEGHTGLHTKKTGHPTVTTENEALALRLAEEID